MGMLGSIKGIATNAYKAGLKEDYMSYALKGGMIGAGIGGVKSAVDGGSFFDGAFNGAMTGAAIGAGVKAYKVGSRLPRVAGQLDGQTMMNLEKVTSKGKPMPLGKGKGTPGLGFNTPVKSTGGEQFSFDTVTHGVTGKGHPLPTGKQVVENIKAQEAVSNPVVTRKRDVGQKLLDIKNKNMG